MTARQTRAQSRERTRQRLIAAVARVFAAKGYHGATVDDVAEAAGYTKGAVYANFASKTDLMIALIEERVRRQSELAAAAFAGVSLEEGLRAMDAGSSGQSGLDREWMLLIGEFMVHAMRDERTRAALADEYEQARALSAAMIAAKYLEVGSVPPLPARDLAILIEAVAVGLSFQMLIDPGRVSMNLQAVAIERLLGPGAAESPRALRMAAGRRAAGSVEAVGASTGPEAGSETAPGSAPEAPSDQAAAAADVARPAKAQRPQKPARPEKPGRPKKPKRA
jgi:AcrR family transcriptional regulator